MTDRTSRLAVALVGVLVALTSGCADPVAPSTVLSPVVVTPADPRAALAQAEARWASWRLKNYDFTVFSPCPLCRLPSRVRFEVRDGVGQAVGVDAATARHFAFASTIDLIFASLHTALDHPAFRFEAAYHPTYGYPVSYFVDLDALTADDEGGVTVENFVVR